MLTIARNISLGLGMSTADGTIATNGVQPLATLAYAVCFWVVNGDRTLGVACVLVFLIVMSLISAALLFRIGKLVFTHTPQGKSIAFLVAAVWYASPIMVRHSMNGLETGMYVAMVLLAVVIYIHYSNVSSSNISIPKCVLLGVVLGATFLSRNDAVFFIFAICFVHIAIPIVTDRALLGRRLFECIVFGSVSVLVAVPWLIYNTTIFGTIVPISGIAESYSASFAHNLSLVSAKLLEYLLIVVPIPRTLESNTFTIGLGVFVLIILVVKMVTNLRSWQATTRTLALVVGVYALGLVTYYGLFFGADHFLSRYFSPLSPFLALVTFAFLVAMDRRLSISDRLHAKSIVFVGLSVWLLAMHALIYKKGENHEHFQVIEWVKHNVKDEEWVGAVQTGTLGFFHDRSVNLDGKVNPDALKVKMEVGTVYPYVINSKIKYLVDWVGITNWVEEKEYKFSEYFKVIVKDNKRNLGVLVRVQS